MDQGNPAAGEILAPFAFVASIVEGRAAQSLQVRPTRPHSPARHRAFRVTVGTCSAPFFEYSMDFEFVEPRIKPLIHSDFWAGRRVFLTGHTGFKGAWMSLLLRLLGRSSPCSMNQWSAWRALPSSATLSKTSAIASCTRRSGSFSSRSSTFKIQPARPQRVHHVEPSRGVPRANAVAAGRVRTR